jgi:hypothetical protein
MDRARRVLCMLFVGTMTIRMLLFILCVLIMGRWLDQLRNDAVAMAGGFSLHDVYKRGLFEAYAGLGCILLDELDQVEVA